MDSSARPRPMTVARLVTWLEELYSPGTSLYVRTPDGLRGVIKLVEDPDGSVVIEPDREWNASTVQDSRPDSP